VNGDRLVRPPHHRPVPSPAGSVNLALPGIVGGILLAPVMLVAVGGIPGLLVAIGCIVAGGVIGHQVSDSRSDSDASVASCAERRNVPLGIDVKKTHP
jgi:hypothetical protein